MLALGEGGFSPGVGNFFDDFGLGGVRVDRTRDRQQAESPFHGQCEFADHVTGMGGDDRRTHNGIGSFFDVYASKALILPSRYRSIHFVEC